VSECAGQTTSCFAVGKKDADCGGRFCCFNGCANVCRNPQTSTKKQEKINKIPPKIFKKPTNGNIQQDKTSNQKPQVQCPSALECVPKLNCDFNGVITPQPVRLNPWLEQQRVPLIPCVNQNQRKTTHVCCRLKL